MISFLWNSILRDTFFKLHCKQCKFKSMFSVVMLWHLSQKHKIKPTKKRLALSVAVQPTHAPFNVCGCAPSVCGVYGA